MMVKRYLSNVEKWILPPALSRIIRFTLGIYRTPPLQAELLVSCASNSKYHNIHLGKKCFILATGPSIEHQNLQVLKNQICFAVSHFYLHKDIKTISPQYHVVAPYHSPFDFSAINTLFHGFDTYYPDSVTYFFGHKEYTYSVYNFLKKYPQFKRNNSSFINYSHRIALGEENFKDPTIWDISKKPFCPRTVIYIAIQIAVYMGFTSIYLLGCDHDYLYDIGRVKNHHFYPDGKGVSDSEHLSAFTRERWFEEYYYRWKQYRLMRTYLEQKGITIYNATQGGMLDVFPRVKLENIVSNTPRLSD